MPFFTIVIPTYNREKIISQAIKSVLKQEYEAWELLVIDDGSSDNTKSVVQSFDDPRIQYIYQENSERGAARNNGVKHAKGDYVFFLDSDDLIYPNHLKHAHDVIEKLHEPEFFHSRYEEVKGKQKTQVPKLNQSTIRSVIEKQNMFACQFFLRKDVAVKTPFNENRLVKIGEDWEVVLKIAARYPLHISNEVTAAIVQHEGRSMSMPEVNDIIVSKDLILESLSKDPKITINMLNNFDAELTTLAALSAALHREKKTAWKLFWKGYSKNRSQLFKRRFLAIIKHILFS